jgi:signal transduction histidine kinase
MLMDLDLHVGQDAIKWVFQQTYGNSPEGFCYCKIVYMDGVPRDGELIYANNTFRAITGIEQTSPSRLSEFISPNWRERLEVLIRLENELNLNSSEKIEIYVPRLDNWYTYSLTSISRGYFAIILHDIRNIKEREINLIKINSLLDATLDASGEGIIAVSKELTIVKFNTKFCELFHIPAHLRISPDTNAFLKFVLPRLKRPEQFFEELKYVTDEPTIVKESLVEMKDGRILSRHSRPQFYNDEIIGRVVSFSDISELRNVESELKSKIERLTEMNRMLEDYAYTNQELSQFAYVASHQLQAPIRTISNYINVIREDYGAILDDQVSTYLNTINESTGRMSSLIDALLEYSRLGRKTRLEKCRISEIIDGILSDLSYMIESSGAVIRVSGMPVIQVHRVEFRQLMQNLITNAIKFRKKDDVPEIIISSEHLPNGWKFSISDNGIGINPKYFKRIFDIFQRLHYNEDEYEGKGIGLAYCKKIVEMHGGEISVESSEGNGATFSFLIPENQPLH